MDQITVHGILWKYLHTNEMFSSHNKHISNNLLETFSFRFHTAGCTCTVCILYSPSPIVNVYVFDTVFPLGAFALCVCLKGLSYEIDFENVDEN
jgi:hypothetical protein